MKLFLTSLVVLIVTFFMNSIVFDQSVVLLSHLRVVISGISAVICFFLVYKFIFNKAVANRGLFLRILFVIFTLPPTFLFFSLIIWTSVFTPQKRILDKGETGTENVVIGEEKNIRGTRIYKFEKSFFRDDNAFVVQEKPIFGSKYFFLIEEVCFQKYAEERLDFEIVDDYNVNCITANGTEKVKLPY